MFIVLFLLFVCFIAYHLFRKHEKFTGPELLPAMNSRSRAAMSAGSAPGLPGTFMTPHAAHPHTPNLPTKSIPAKIA